MSDDDVTPTLDDLERKPSFFVPPANVVTPPAPQAEEVITIGSSSSSGANKIDLTNADSHDGDSATSSLSPTSSESLNPVFTQRAKVPATSQDAGFASPVAAPSRVLVRPRSPSSPRAPQVAGPSSARRPTAYDTQAHACAFFAGEKRPRSNSRIVRDDRFQRSLMKSPMPLSGGGAGIRAPRQEDAQGAIGITPTGKRKARQFPVRYELDVPSSAPTNDGEADYDGPCPPELRDSQTQLAWTTRALLTQRGLTENTLRDYKKKVAHSWDPFCELVGACRVWPTVVQVLMWIVHLYQSGTRSHATIVQYVLARTKLQPRLDENGLERASPFLDRQVKEMMRSCKNRLRASPDGSVEDHALVRAPLPPTDVRRISEVTNTLINDSYNALSSHDGSAALVEHAHLLQIRDGLSVCIGYTFGFRAGHLHDLEFGDVDFGRRCVDEPTNVAWGTLPSVSECARDGKVAMYLRVSAHRNKTHAPLEVRQDGGRVLRSSPWMRTLSTMIARWRSIRRWWHSLRIDIDALESGAEVVTCDEPVFTAPDASAWQDILNRLRDDHLDHDRIFVMPFAIPSPSATACADVQQWMMNSLTRANCLTRPQGPRKYTSHSIRSGGASSAWLVTRSLPIVRWWFRWSNNSRTPEQCYLAFDWYQLQHEYERDAVYFFGWMASYEYDATQYVDKLIQESRRHEQED